MDSDDPYNVNDKFEDLFYDFNIRCNMYLYSYSSENPFEFENEEIPFIILDNDLGWYEMSYNRYVEGVLDTIY